MNLKRAIIFGDTTLLNSSTGSAIPAVILDQFSQPYTLGPTDQVLLTGFQATITPVTYGLLTVPAGIVLFDSLTGSSSNYLVTLPAAPNQPMAYSTIFPSPGLPLSVGAGLAFCGFGSASLVLVNFFAQANILIQG